MDDVSLCLTLGNDASVPFSNENCERYYEKVYKKIISFLFAHPTFKFSFAFSGLVLCWLKENRPEFIQALRELYKKKQVELIGGGFYNPIFPLICHQDRVNQIDLLTTEIKNATGKRPWGISLGCSVWSNTLISAFSTCGMDYVQLDSSLISPMKQNFLPLILTESEKSIKVLPVYNVTEDLALSLKSIDDILGGFLKKIRASEKKLKYPFDSNSNKKVLTLNFDQRNFEILLKNNFLEELYALLEGKYKAAFEIQLPQDYIKSSTMFVPTYVNAGMIRDIEKWASVPYTEIENKSGFPLTIFDFLQVYRRNKALYDRMIFVSMLINQSYGDKSRKKTARDYLWTAQNADAYVCTPDGIFSNSLMRQTAYKNLTEAEKLIRGCTKSDGKGFSESVSSFDYNGDGIDEYVCRMEKYTACISTLGACIFELDIMKTSGNYADNFSRIEKFDKFDDNYDRGIFIEHLFTESEFKDYKKRLPTGNGIFTRVRFAEKKFDAKKKEISLAGIGFYGNSRQRVSLLKKIIATSNGFTIQFILKNESDRRLQGVLVTESNFAQTDFSSAEKNSYCLEVITKNKKEVPEISKKGISLEKVSFAAVTDYSNSISFIFEPNEDASLFCMPLTFKRPKTTKELTTAGTTFVTSICWNVDLESGMEMEKYISFNIVIPRKKC